MLSIEKDVLKELKKFIARINNKTVLVLDKNKLFCIKIIYLRHSHCFQHLGERYKKRTTWVKWSTPAIFFKRYESIQKLWWLFNHNKNIFCHIAAANLTTYFESSQNL